MSAYWESDIDGVLSNVDSEPDSTGTIVGYEYLTEGEHAIELHVEDSTGKTDRETVIINVGPPNSAPLCEILTPVDGSAGAEGSTSFCTSRTIHRCEDLTQRCRIGRTHINNDSFTICFSSTVFHV